MKFIMDFSTILFSHSILINECDFVQKFLLSKFISATNITENTYYFILV